VKEALPEVLLMAEEMAVWRSLALAAAVACRANDLLLVPQNLWQVLLSLTRQ
jgi:hypothetical protein